MRSEAGAPATAGWAKSVDLAVRLVFVILLALVLLSTARPMITEYHRLEAAGQIGLLCLVLVQVAVVALTLSGRFRSSRRCWWCSRLVVVWR